MKVFKFRVWDKDLKRMHICGENIHDSMTFDENNNACYYNLQNGEGSEPDGAGTYDLMEYTGFQDKNSTEIYRGDIVAESYKNPLTREMTTNLYLIDWDGFYHMNDVLKRPGRNRFLWMQYKEIEVIGNVWENPELLEVQA